MLFNTSHFFAFFALVLLLTYGAPARARRWILLAASYYFYICWIPRFLILLITLTAIDYGAALWIASSSGRSRRMALITGLSANLLFLGFFKYYNFFAANLALLFGLDSRSFAFEIILPMGISFHTFQSMSYVIDVYRRQQEPIRSPVDYALFIAFFPQLVAGPIVRAREFFADFYHWRAPDREDALRGTLQVLLGLTKKMAFADQFALLADAYFQNPAAHHGNLPAWGGVIAFGLQIYFDFSGYTDMAIGTAKLLGFHFPANFARPYLAASITDFWRRWHMSLSRWLRDYLYISLGGNRRGEWLTYRNLLLTMLLGGLWHGASWNFVIWGGYHGLLLAIEKKTGWYQVRRWPFPRIVFTFTLVMIGWVFFRAATFADSMETLRQMFFGWGGTLGFRKWHWALIVSSLALAVAEEKRQWFERLVAAPAWAYAAAVFALLFTLELFGVTDLTVPFVYFQF